MLTFNFNFNKEELFAALAPFVGKKRMSLIGMFKHCKNMNDALSIAYFLHKNNLGDYKLVQNGNHSFKWEIYLYNKVTPKVVLPNPEKIKVLLYV